MPKPIIEVENLSKLYKVGTIGRTSIRDSFDNLLRKVGVIKDPEWSKYKKHQMVTSAFSAEQQGPKPNTFWALKDVSFSVNQGEVVGIIGRNGSGKSTLLKILSRITEPTSGRAILRGRVASLLEVGTGFHPDLTGRENIYMNGAILGMRKWEIAKKFDEIVAFAELDKFIDTPVKHYSSGMYVRLAFAVAAHLEPEILFVDEVLAVGDIQFQKKCLGKMEAVARQGRTILFVSHNLAAIKSLCQRGLLLTQGALILNSGAESAITRYLADSGVSNPFIAWSDEDAPSSSEIKFRKAYIANSLNQPVPSVTCNEGFTICLEYEVIKPVQGLVLGFMMQNQEGIVVCGSDDAKSSPPTKKEPGSYVSKCSFPGHVLNVGGYAVLFGADLGLRRQMLVRTDYCLSLTIIDDLDRHNCAGRGLPGILRPNLDWREEKTK